MGNVLRIRRLFRESLPLFSALGDPVRQQLLLAMITERPQSVHELAAGTNLARPTVSHHLRILQEAGIITHYKVGRNIFYHPQHGHYVDIMRELMHEVDQAIQKEGTR